MQDLNLNFMHPRYGTVLNVDISAATTIEETIAHLLRSGFVPPHAAGYRLAKGEEVFPLEAELSALKVEDGDIIRIEPKEKVESGLSVHIKHPHRGLMFGMQVEEDMQAQEVIARLQERGFIEAKEAGYVLRIGEGIELRGAQSLSEAKLKEEDFIRLIDLSEPAEPEWKKVLSSLQSQLDELKEAQLNRLDWERLSAEQQRAQQEALRSILLQFFPTLATAEVPEVQQQAPRRKTASTYEPLRHLLLSIRNDAGLAAPKDIVAWSPIPLLAYTFLVMGLLTAFYFLITYFQ